MKEHEHCEICTINDLCKTKKNQPCIELGRFDPNRGCKNTHEIMVNAINDNMNIPKQQCARCGNNEICIGEYQWFECDECGAYINTNY